MFLEIFQIENEQFIGRLTIATVSMLQKLTLKLNTYFFIIAVIAYAMDL
jgi:hypothetical protein